MLCWARMNAAGDYTWKQRSGGPVQIQRIGESFNQAPLGLSKYRSPKTRPGATTSICSEDQENVLNLHVFCCTEEHFALQMNVSGTPSQDTFSLLAAYA